MIYASLFVISHPLQECTIKEKNLARVLEAENEG